MVEYMMLPIPRFVYSNYNCSWLEGDKQGDPFQSLYCARVHDITLLPPFTFFECTKGHRGITKESLKESLMK